MTKEQREHVEATLIDMMEKLHKGGIDANIYSPEALTAAAEAARALIALEESAPLSPKARISNAIGGKAFSVEEIRAMVSEASFRATGKPPVRGIAIEMPERNLRADAPGLYEAIAKLSQLYDTLTRLFGSPERTAPE